MPKHQKSPPSRSAKQTTPAAPSGHRGRTAAALHQSPATSASSTPRRRLITSARLATLLVILLVCIVGVSVWLHYYFSDTVTAERELPAIAQDYYENYYYDELMAVMDGPEGLERYTKRGLPETRLRQLLHYDNNKYYDYAPLFERLGCNFNTSKVTFWPEEPYGREDYRVEYHLRCTTEFSLGTQIQVRQED